MNISVIGLGKLGSPMAAVFAQKGYTVVGVDLNQGFVDAINAGRAPVVEPRLQELISANRERLSATTSYEEAISQTDASFLIVPTPSNADGVFINDYVVDACRAIGQVLRHKAGYHLVVVTATVMPGSTGSVIRQALEETSGKRCGVDLGLCYSPEFIALGSVVTNLLNPDFVLVGESDAKAGEMLATIYRTTVDNGAPVARMNFVNAEIVKISINTFVTTKISYANMLAEICERIPGADVDVVTAAVGRDKRIGTRYLRGASGYGGPCFPRDNVAFGKLAASAGVSADIALATDRINRRQAARLAERLAARLTSAARVGIMGIAYKPDTPVIEESQAIFLAQALLQRGFSVVIYDPLAAENARKALGEAPVFARSVHECAQQVDALVIMTPTDEFKTLEPADFRRDHAHKVLVLDVWRILDPQRFASVCEYAVVGAGPQSEGALSMAEK